MNQISCAGEAAREAPGGCKLADFVHFPELQRSDGHRTADSAAGQDRHLCQSPQEQHHGPGVPGTDARVASTRLALRLRWRIPLKPF